MPTQQQFEEMCFKDSTFITPMSEEETKKSCENGGEKGEQVDPTSSSQDKFCKVKGFCNCKIS